MATLVVDTVLISNEFITYRRVLTISTPVSKKQATFFQFYFEPLFQKKFFPHILCQYGQEEIYRKKNSVF